MLTISNNLHKRRIILGLSMQDLADRLKNQGVNISKATISKYEKGTTSPRASILSALAKALECSPEYLLSTEERTIQWLRFRRKTSLSKKAIAHIKETAIEWLQARLSVEEAIGRRHRKSDISSYKVDAIEQAEGIAQDLRDVWNVGNWPIESLTLATEEFGVFVIEIEMDKNLDGLSGIADDEIRFVVIPLTGPVDRKRMNLAHELGHILIQPTSDEDFDEKVAFRFGAALLIPKDVMYKRIGNKRSTIDLRELLILKQEYGISVQALVRRCFDLQIISQRTYKNLNIEMRSKQWHKNEPGDCSQLERPSIFRSDLLRCISEGYISESKVRSMFPEVAKKVYDLDSDSFWQWQNLRDKPREERDTILEAAAEEASEEYLDNGSLAGFEVIDDEES